MIVFPCQMCRAKLSAEPVRIGALVRCPSCQTTQRVPTPQASPAAVATTVRSSMERNEAVDVAPPPRPAPRAPRPPNPLTDRAAVFGKPATGKRYGFNCPYCSSRLEASEMMAATEGQCPTCGSTIVIPILDRYGRLIDPLTKKIIKPDPHPVHAYAAAGERAPTIVRTEKNALAIRCPRCPAVSPITANNCKACGMPFTMEGTTVEAAGTNNGLCVASLVLGVIGMPAGCTVVLPVLAIVFGVIGLIQSLKQGGSGRWLAVTGIACGVVGCFIAANIYFR